MKEGRKRDIWKEERKRDIWMEGRKKYMEGKKKEYRKVGYDIEGV